MIGGEIHRLSVLLFTDIVGSVQLQERLGTQDYARLLKRHDELFREALKDTSGQILKHTGDGFLAEFTMSSAAVATALRFQRFLSAEDWSPEPIKARVGLHQGEVLVVDANDPNEAAPLAVGMAVNLAARVMDLAVEGQILITRPVYESARYYLKDHLDSDGDGIPESIRWVAHGEYEFKGSDDPMDILEVGFEDIAPFVAPEGGLKSRRARPHEENVLPEVQLGDVPGSDVFISYANLDNEPLAEGEEGWVTRLHDSLSLRLSQLLGRKPRVWRDPKSDHLDDWHEELADGLKEVRTMVPVISPPYLTSEGCQRELQAFGEFSSDPDRMIQVVKTPAEEDAYAPETKHYLDQSPRIEFFEREIGGRLYQFDSSLGEEPRRRFLHGVYDLAYEISKRVRQSGQPIGSPEKTVYLAETTYDLREARTRIKRDFQERGYRVLPDRPLPLEAEELRRRVHSEMEQADVVVHLIGRRYGVVPEESDRSLVEMQCAISAEMIPTHAFSRFFWAPKQLEFEDPRQATFFTALEQGEFQMERTEFIRGSLEELKRLALARLSSTAAAEPEPAFTDPANDVQMIYLMCAPSDQEAVEPIEDYLYEQGYEVKISPDDGDAKLRTEMHRQILTLCDGVLIYFGESSHQWAEMMLMDVMKAPGFGRDRPIHAQGVYVAPPFNRRKERFRTRSALVMRGEETFSPEALQPFLDQLGSSRPLANA